MKASVLTKKLIENIAEHGDFEICSEGKKIEGISFSDSENIPDMKTEPWYEIIVFN